MLQNNDLNCILKVIVIILSGSFLTQTPSSAEHVSVRSVCARSTVHSERRDDRHPNLTQTHTHTHMALESSSLLPAVCEMNQGLCDRARGANETASKCMRINESANAQWPDRKFSNNRPGFFTLPTPMQIRRHSRHRHPCPCPTTTS